MWGGLIAKHMKADQDLHISLHNLLVQTTSCALGPGHLQTTPLLSPRVAAECRPSCGVYELALRSRNDGFGLVITHYWLPVGADGYFVRTCSSAWETVDARLHRRPKMTLFHSALIVEFDSDRYAIEMAPAWMPGVPADRGVVGEGPVGAQWAGRSRFFRYELRCWRGGEIPDAKCAVGGPRLLTDNPTVARELLADMPSVPMYVWGRDPGDCGDMWNSNSAVAWLLSRAGLSADSIAPPAGGRAPGWAAGLSEAARLTADRSER